MIAARRSLAFTYPIRYYLKGAQKQQFFDFMQSDLEASLEKLNKQNELDWWAFLDQDAYGKAHVGERFFKFK